MPNLAKWSGKHRKITIILIQRWKAVIFLWQLGSWTDTRTLNNICFTLESQKDMRRQHWNKKACQEKGQHKGKERKCNLQSTKWFKKAEKSHKKGQFRTCRWEQNIKKSRKEKLKRLESYIHHLYVYFQYYWHSDLDFTAMLSFLKFLQGLELTKSKGSVWRKWIKLKGIPLPAGKVQQKVRIQSWPFKTEANCAEWVVVSCVADLVFLWILL